jgi:uncharacterized membrane protein (UPF0127 family)
MNIFRRTTALLATLFCLAFALAGAPSANAGTTRASAEDLARLPKASLVIESAGKRLPFDVWVAATPERRAQGLMFVKTLPKNGGMLFLFPAPMVAAFWMKNTFMPLDLLFVRENGTIARIAENARPHDLSPLPGGEPVLAVLELAGGTAAKLGLRAGDRLVSTALRASEQ